jgi:L-lactate dehydrogenase complex protein LldF
MNGHPEAAARFVANGKKARRHDEALWWLRVKRDMASVPVPDWERLREAAEAIKQHTLSRLADYVEEFESSARAVGAEVWFARDAVEHNAIVHRILAERGVTKLVKSKSMLTEECHLNAYLESRGIEVTDTDLGERIVQLRKEPPSHIVMPAIHLTKGEVGELFHLKLGTDRGASDPRYLTDAARKHLRQLFLEAQAGLTGVNFAVAETGEVIVCTNEGNADMGTSLPPIHIACMGVEKLIPRRQDLAVFLRLLARSATGQPVTTYTTHFHGPRPGGELHIVLVDNGRSAQLADETFRRSLSCIRCGACLNTCPVYRRSGGYSYNWTVPGPIGIVLATGRNASAHRTLPLASSLCGSCSDICPVRIDLHHEILAWRKEIARRGLLSFGKRASMKVLGWVLRFALLYRVAGWLMRHITLVLPRLLVYGRWNVWGRQRELPPMPRQSFRRLYRKQRVRA